MPPRTKRPTKRSTSSGAAEKPRAKVTVEDLADFNESINIMVYGDSGVGKTPFAGGAPNAVFLSTERGTISAKRFGSTARLIRATDWELLEAGIEYLEAHPDDFDWVILDSVTKMQVLLMRYILKKQNEENSSRDLDIPAIQDHQKWQNMFKRFIDRIIDLPVNTIFVATAMHREDAEGEDLVLPDIQGKDYAIAQYVCAQMDGVYCLKVKTDAKTKEPTWRLLTKTQPPYFAKDRYNALGTVVVAPDMASIAKAIKDSANEMGWTKVASDSLDTPSESIRRAKRRATADDIEDEDGVDPSADDFPDEIEDIDDPEELPKRPVRRGQARRPRRTPQARESQSRTAEDDPEPDDEEEPDESPSHQGTTAREVRRSRATRRPARTSRQQKNSEPEDLDDDFDPEDNLDL